MSGEATRAAYRKAFDRRGFTGLLRRYSGTGNARPHVEVSVRMRHLGGASEELLGAMTQDAQPVLLLAEDVIAAGWMPPIKRGDKLFYDGREFNIEAVDGSKRREGDAVMAYELVVKG